jgi:signal transduction histidine kinase
VSVSRKAYSASVQLASDSDSFKKQESIFIILNLFILAVLLLIHTLFAPHWGEPSTSLIAVLAGAFVVQLVELVWLDGRRRPLGPKGIILLTCFSVVLNFSLAFLLELLSNRDDIQYFIVMVIPILQSAFRFPLLATLAVVGFADFINFFWVWDYGQHHPMAPVSEYFEAGTISLIYTSVAVLVWLLVNQLHRKELKLSESLEELSLTKERLLLEEKLAAVGRLSSAIAHEIRNPVAVIASALSTASRGGLESSEREEMFGIATQEASRLEKLTSDFLAYARPRDPRRAPTSIADTLGYVVAVCSPRSVQNGVTITAKDSGELMANLDAAQVQQALINLVVNAVEASPASGRVTLQAMLTGSGSICIEVEDGGGPIAADAASRIFEPFFTTKAQGTGLGLAIARNIARAHGGDLVLSMNDPGRVCFSLTLPATVAESSLTSQQGSTDGQNPGR